LFGGFWSTLPEQVDQNTVNRTRELAVMTELPTLIIIIIHLFTYLRHLFNCLNKINTSRTTMLTDNVKFSRKDSHGPFSNLHELARSIVPGHTLN